LIAIQHAIDGRIDEAIAKFKKSEDLLGAGLLIFGLFVLGSIVMLYLDGPRPFSFGILLGLITCLPMVLLGLIRVDRVRRLLDRSEAETPSLAPPNNVNALPARATDPLEITPEMRGSITEPTTLHLDQRKPKTARD
jgi:hypothetical protein